MSKCCKGKCWCKFLPHNWLCLKGLSVLFLVFFYVCLAFAVYMAYQIGSHPMITGTQMWAMLGFYVGQALAGAIGCLTVAKILKALGKIKQAVAPCCQEEPAEEKKSK